VAGSSGDLLRRAAGGDHDTLAGVLERYGPAVRQHIGHKVPRRWRSLLSLDDVMQQTYLDAFLDIDRFAGEDEASFIAWLTSLAKCNLIDGLRALVAEKRGGRWHRLTPETCEDSFIAFCEMVGHTGSTPSGRVARQEAITALAWAIRQLPEAYRLSVQMYDLEGRSAQEVADALKRSPGAVLMMRARAHRRIRGLLGSSARYFSTR
jgi:RNA polymerase sigma factor (sigma-70 family)